jgi:hypothetical protein
VDHGAQELEGGRVRLALCGLTPIVDGIVTLLVGDVDGIEIVARLEPSPDLVGDFESSGADMLICAVADREMADRWNAALRSHPPLTVLNLGRDATRGRLLGLRSEDWGIDELTAESLIDAISRHMSSRERL